MNKYFKITILSLVIAELVSFLGFYVPAVNTAGFFAIVAIALILSLKRLEYGLLILLAELFIGSKGYLFYFESGGLSVSIRIALWLIVMSVWFAKALGVALKNRRVDSEYFRLSWLTTGVGPYFLILFIFIVWGFINGLLGKNGFANVFFDFNGWLFFALFFPVNYLIRRREIGSRGKPDRSRTLVCCLFRFDRLALRENIASSLYFFTQSARSG